jgi:hypothetical protein
MRWLKKLLGRRKADRWVSGFVGMLGMGEWYPPQPLTQRMLASDYYNAERDTYYGLPIYKSKKEADRAFVDGEDEESLRERREWLAGYKEWEGNAALTA